MGWLSGWSYRKSHVINSASGAGTNYQVKIVAHYGSGTDSGADVYLNSHCKTDFGDVRFTDDDGTTLLDYWMESKVDGDYAVFWVEVADDLSTNPATIYIYYGKSDATTTSNGDNTFLFFDDFNGDLSKWTQISGTWIIAYDSEYGVNVLRDPGSDNSRIRANGVTITNNRIRFKARMTTTAGLGLQCRARADSDLATSYVQLDEYMSGNSYGITGGTSVSFTFGTVYHISDFRLFGTDTDHAKANVDSSGPATSTQTTSLTSGYFGLRRGINSTNRFFVDWIFVAKYVSPEPAHGSWGSEETPSGGQTYEIYLDAVSQTLSTSTYETTYNIAKDAAITSQSLHVSETTFNILKDAITETLASAVVEVVAGVVEIFKDAVATAQAKLDLESTLNISLDAVTITQALASALSMLSVIKDATVQASATSTYEVTFTLPLSAFVNASSLSTFKSTFNITPEATVQVQAQVSVVKEGEIKVTKLFLIIGDLAIQIQGI